MKFNELMKEAMKEVMRKIKKVCIEREAVNWHEECWRQTTQNDLTVYGMKRYFSYPP